jgi:hypothetical protein
MEQSTIIILAIVFIAIVIAMQPAVCDCTTEGAASAPVMSAYLKQVRLPERIEAAPIAYPMNNYIKQAAVAYEKFAQPSAVKVYEKFGQGNPFKQYVKTLGVKPNVVQMKKQN